MLMFKINQLQDHIGENNLKCQWKTIKEAHDFHFTHLSITIIFEIEEMFSLINLAKTFVPCKKCLP